jgi:dephospho-CoA kinase
VGKSPKKEVWEVHILKIIGVTGGIGSGKSTVSRILRDLGAKIVSADKIARDIVHKG